MQSGIPKHLSDILCFWLRIVNQKRKRFVNRSPAASRPINDRLWIGT